MRKDQPFILLVSLSVATVGIVLEAIFAGLYAHSLHLFQAIGGAVWLALLVLLLWLVIVLRLTHPQRMAASRRFTIRRPAIPITIAFVCISVVWLLFALGQHDNTPLFSLHWIVQLALASTYLFVMGLRCVRIAPEPAEISKRMLELWEKRRADLLGRIDSLRESEWLRAAGADETGQRLRAALAWWREELDAALSLNRISITEPSMKLILDLNRRDVDWLETLMDRNETSRMAMMEAERRVLEAQERLGEEMMRLS